MNDSTGLYTLGFWEDYLKKLLFIVISLSVYIPRHKRVTLWGKGQLTLWGVEIVG